MQQVDITTKSIELEKTDKTHTEGLDTTGLDYDFIEAISSDSYRKRFEKSDEMIKFLQKVASNDQWHTSTIEDTEVGILQGGGLFIQQEVAEKGLNFGDIPESIVAQTANERETVDGGTCLYLKNQQKDKSYLIGQSAIDSLTERHGAKSVAATEAAKEESPKETYVELLGVTKKIEKIAQRETVSLERGGKLRTINSDRYTPIRTDELFELLENNISSSLGEVEFKEGAWTHEIVRAEWILSEFADEIAEKYFGEVDLKSYDWTPRLVFRNGDLANSSITLQARLDASAGFSILLGDVLSIRHTKKKEDIFADFEEAIDQLFALYTQKLDQLDGLKGIEIPRALDWFNNYADKIQLPKTDEVRKSIWDEIHLFFGNNKTTAYQLFIWLQEAVVNARREEYSLKKVIGFEESLARMLPKRSWKLY